MKNGSTMAEVGPRYDFDGERLGRRRGLRRAGYDPDVVVGSNIVMRLLYRVTHYLNKSMKS